MTWDEEAREALRAVPGLAAEEDDAILTALAPIVAAEVARGKAEAWSEGWDASVDAGERCDVAGGDYSCGSCATCDPINPYSIETEASER